MLSCCDAFAGASDLPIMSRIRQRALAHEPRAVVWLTAVAAWCSLNPYFLWGALPWSMLAAAAFGAVALVWLVICGNARQLSKTEAIGISLVTLFILYITLQSRVDGGHSKWVLVLPVVWSVWLMRDEQRSRCYRAFATLFAVSLIPGALASLVAASGIPRAFTTIPAGNAQFAAQGGQAVTAARRSVHGIEQHGAAAWRRPVQDERRL